MTVWLDFRDIRSKVTLEQVLLEMYGLGDRLKRQGKKLIGPCPIHQGDSPRAFQADLEKQLYFCFTGCGKKGGNALDFVIAMDRCTVREAALKLQAAFIAPHEGAPSAPTTLATTSKPESSSSSAAAPSTSAAAKTPTPPPSNGDEGGSTAPNPPLALRLELAHDHPHVVRDRGLTPEAAKRWGVGYCHRGMLRGMIAIRIDNEDGECVAYAGRRLKPKEIEAYGKYRMPKHFRRDLVLYNLHSAKRCPPEDGLIAVEGFFATITLVERGLPNVVASMGCSLSEAQADLLAEHTAHVTMLYDGDPSGRVGADQALSLLDTRGVTASVVRLPEGRKPDQTPIRLIRWAVHGVRLLGLRELVITPQPAASNDDAAPPQPTPAK